MGENHRYDNDADFPRSVNGSALPEGWEPPDNHRYVILAQSEVSGKVHISNGRGEAPRFLYCLCGAGIRGRQYEGPLESVTCAACKRGEGRYDRAR